MMTKATPRIALIAACIILGPIGCSAQSKKQGARGPEQEARSPAERRQQGGERRAPVEVENLIADAQSAPAEFAADVLLRSVESGKITDPKKRVELLETAFRRASEAQHQFRREYVGGLVDTRPGYLSHAYDLKLDALSLRSRAVRNLLAEDKRKARALLSSVSPKLDLKPLDCDDRLVYNVSDFYSVIKEVANSAFTPKEVKQDLHVHFIIPYVGGITSSAQVEPVVRLILGIKPSPSQLAILVTEFSSAIKAVANDDRSFSSSLIRGEVVEGIAELIKACGDQGGLKRQLLEALRTHFIKSLNGSRCADSVARISPASGQSAHLTKINDAFFAENPLLTGDIKPSEVKTATKAYPYWQSNQAQELLAKVKKLRFGSGREPLAVSERSSAEWQLEMTAFLNDLKAWDAEDENTEADYFHQKCVLYEGLLDLVPTSPTRDALLTDYLSHLTGNRMRQDSRIEWFWYVNNLIKKVNLSKGEELLKSFEALSNSGDVTIRLYASLNRLTFPSSPLPGT